MAIPKTEKIWHNVVGRPIERSMQVSGNYKELTQVLEELKHRGLDP